MIQTLFGCMHPLATHIFKGINQVTMQMEHHKPIASQSSWSWASAVNVVQDALVLYTWSQWSPVVLTVRAVNFLALRMNQFPVGSAFSLPNNCNTPTPNPSSASQTLDTMLLWLFTQVPNNFYPQTHTKKSNISQPVHLAHCHGFIWSFKIFIYLLLISRWAATS